MNNDCRAEMSIYEEKNEHALQLTRAKNNRIFLDRLKNVYLVFLLAVRWNRISL